jgi:predicted dehydrogenase
MTEPMTALTVGLVGAGGITHAHAPSWIAMGAELFVYSDQNSEQLEAAYGVTPCASFQELLSRVDIIDVCTPTPAHVEFVLAAIAANKFVVCEKPVGRTVADAMRVLDAATRAGAQVYPGHVVRFFPEYVALRDAVVAGRIGDPAVLRFTRGGTAPSADWFFDRALSGGLVLDQMIHDLDMARWIAGEVVQVFAVQNPPARGDALPRTLVTQVVLTHRSGALSFIQGVWGPPGMQFVTSFDVSGSTGRLKYDSRATRSISENLAAATVTSSYLPSFAAGNPYQSELEEFAAAFDGGPMPRVSLTDGIIAVGMAEAALESIDSGTAVAFDEKSIVTLGALS